MLYTWLYRGTVYTIQLVYVNAQSILAEVSLLLHKQRHIIISEKQTLVTRRIVLKVLFKKILLQ